MRFRPRGRYNRDMSCDGRIKCVLFDMDGTLCNTWLDLARAVQAALAHFGFAPPSDEDVLRFVGNGSFKLIELALPAGKKEFIAEVERFFQQYYRSHLTVHTLPYEGITELVMGLRTRGIKLGVVSNKSVVPLKEITEKFFPGVFDAVYGGCPEMPLKPAPDMIKAAMNQLNVTETETLYVGDSDVDVRAAKNAGVSGVFCAWGFQSEDKLVAAGAERVVRHPSEILACL